MADSKFQAFSLLGSVKRKEGQEPLSEAKMMQLLKQLFRGWEHGEIVLGDVIGKREEKKA